MASSGKHLSNIGVRRQQTSRNPASNNTQYLIARPAITHSEVSNDKVYLPAETHDTSSRQVTRAKLRTPKRENFAKSTSDPQNRANVVEDIEIIRNDHRSSVNARLIPPSEKDDDFPPLLLINPNSEVLPVVKTAQAKGAFDFYINSYVTSILEVSPRHRAPYSQVIHQILHDELLFTAFTTVSEATRCRTQDLYSDPSPNVVRGYGKTIQLLSKKLQSERFAMSPTVLLTMGQLVAVETLIKNVSATARHLAGMQAAMRPKPTNAPDSSAPVRNAVDIWTMYFMRRAIIRPSIPKIEALTYPQHPFEPNLGEQIADLPPGFSDIALSGRLSVELLDLLTRFATYYETINKLNKEGNMDMPYRTDTILEAAAYCIEYHQIRTLTVIERLVVTALTAFVVRRDRIHPALINMRNYFQITCAYMVNVLSRHDGLQKEDHDSDLVTWAGLLLLLTSSPEAHARKLALKLLPRKPEPIKLIVRCEKFFWDADLTHALLSGQILVTSASNDIISDNVKQALPDAVRQVECEDPETE